MLVRREVPRGNEVVKALRYYLDGPGIDSRCCHWIFQWHIPSDRGPGVNSAPSENEYQEHFLGVKAAGAWGWHLNTFMCQMSWKSGSPNLLEPSEPHRACYGTPLPLSFTCIKRTITAMHSTLWKLWAGDSAVGEYYGVWEMGSLVPHDKLHLYWIVLH